MKKIIKILLCLLVFILLIGFTSTNTTTDKENDNKNISDNNIVVIETHNCVKSDTYEIFYDKDTKVCYLMTGRGGVTPLYNADGSLKIDNEDKE